jgi:hypothetical protein
MLPGISEESESRIAGFLRPEITDLTPELLARRRYEVLERGPAAALGIELVGEGEPLLLVTDPVRPVGAVRIAAPGRDNVIAFDNAAWSGQCTAAIRILGGDCVVVMNDIADGFVRIPTLFMRSHRQLLFWGAGSTAVDVSLELEGEGASLVIGDDALIANGVWIRNYDMHAIHDLAGGAQINRPPCDTVLERHVWLGQDALLLHCERVGQGSIIGARALAKGFVPRHVMVAGAPARVIREGVSWGRSALGMTARERVAIGLPPEPG